MRPYHRRLCLSCGHMHSLIACLPFKNDVFFAQLYCIVIHHVNRSVSWKNANDIIIYLLILIHRFKWTALSIRTPMIRTFSLPATTIFNDFVRQCTRWLVHALQSREKQMHTQNKIQSAVFMSISLKSKTYQAFAM